MTLSFGGRGEVHMNVDPTEFRGLTVNEVAAELHKMARSRADLEYASEDFIMAAEQVVAELNGSRGMNW